MKNSFECFRRVDGKCVRWLIARDSLLGKELRKPRKSQDMRIPPCPEEIIASNNPHDGFYHICARGETGFWAYDITYVHMDLVQVSRC